MKKIAIPFLIILFMLILAACGASTGNQTGSTPSNNNSGSGSQGDGQGNGFSNQPMPIQEQILIGTFKLEGTDKAVSSTQAADLLPLWQTYKDLSTTGTAAQQEIDALTSQIQDTMTSDQMKAITDMKLTRGDLFTIMQTLGLATGGPNASGTPEANRQGGNGSGGGGGGFPGGGGQGGFPGGGGQGGGFGGNGNGQNLTPQQIATFQARRAQGGGGFNRIPSPLMDALIQLLEKKAGS